MKDTKHQNQKYCRAINIAGNPVSLMLLRFSQEHTKIADNLLIKVPFANTLRARSRHVPGTEKPAVSQKMRIIYGNTYECTTRQPVACIEYAVKTMDWFEILEIACSSEFRPYTTRNQH